MTARDPVPSLARLNLARLFLMAPQMHSRGLRLLRAPRGVALAAAFAVGAAQVFAQMAAPVPARAESGAPRSRKFIES